MLFWTAFNCTVTDSTWQPGLSPPCIPTCSDPNALANCTQTPLQDVCQCASGKVVYQGACIDPSQCPCIDDDGFKNEVCECLKMRYVNVILCECIVLCEYTSMWMCNSMWMYLLLFRLVIHGAGIIRDMSATMQWISSRKTSLLVLYLVSPSLRYTLWVTSCDTPFKSVTSCVTLRKSFLFIIIHDKYFLQNRKFVAVTGTHIVTRSTGSIWITTESASSYWSIWKTVISRQSHWSLISTSTDGTWCGHHGTFRTSLGCIMLKSTIVDTSWDLKNLPTNRESLSR